MLLVVCCVSFVVFVRCLHSGCARCLLFVGCCMLFAFWLLGVIMCLCVRVVGCLLYVVFCLLCVVVYWLACLLLLLFGNCRLLFFRC